METLVSGFKRVQRGLDNVQSVAARLQQLVDELFEVRRYDAEEHRSTQ